MRIFQALFFVAAASTAAYCSPGGVLEKVKKIQVDPTIVEQSDKVDYATAANLVRYDLRAAVRDAHLEEGDSPVRAHFVLGEFSSESRARRVIGFGTGRSICTVDGRLVIEDASRKELANIKIHVHGSVAYSPGEGNDARSQPISDFEQRLHQEIERLK
jgi:hypothetical protein